MTESEHEAIETEANERTTTGGRWVAPALRVSLVLLGLFGWIVSSNLLTKSMAPDRSNNFLDKICQPAAEGKEDPCTSVLTSDAAYIRAKNLPPIPWAALGAGYFAFVGIWYLFVGIPNRRGAWWHMVILVVVIYGGFVSLQMVQMMATQLKAWCAGCVLAHVINALIIILSLVAAWIRKPVEAGHGARPSAALAGATFAAGAMFLLLMMLLYLAAGYRNQATNYGSKYAAIVSAPDYILWRYGNEAVRDELAAAPADLYYGNAKAPHVITAFFDLQCTNCRDASKLLRRIVDDNADSVKLVYRHFPLSRQCNPSLDIPAGHNMACAAAAATEAVRQAKGREAALAFMDACYLRTPFFDDAFLLETAEGQGVAREALTQALEQRDTTGAVKSDIELGNALKLTVAPIVFFNGRPLASWNSAMAWETLIENAE